VAEAFNTFAAKMPHLRVLPVYGGADFRDQIARLKRGVQVVVGTPGRVMDHMRQGTLDLSGLRTLVLDEADEMLRMGFIDDVEWVLSQLPEQRQVVLFSATMPPEIRRISRQYLNDPAEITIRQKGDDASRIRQRYITVNAPQKLEALSRVLEAETKEGVIIFARTKAITVAVAESLEAKGYDVAVLNGDVAQSQRERTIDRLKSGHVNVLVATDVAARGLDVDRITLVVNYDIPFDSEAYVHRIGRTGRAGRSGDAILFLTRGSAASWGVWSGPWAGRSSRWRSPATPPSTSTASTCCARDSPPPSTPPRTAAARNWPCWPKSCSGWPRSRRPAQTSWPLQPSG
jgi:ATP-dependent RNA helicase DeaD